jgi:hypothetical protein
VPVELMKAGADEGQRGWDFRVPLVVNVEFGPDWGSMVPLVLHAASASAAE